MPASSASSRSSTAWPRRSPPSSTAALANVRLFDGDAARPARLAAARFARRGRSPLSRPVAEAATLEAPLRQRRRTSIGWRAFWRRAALSASPATSRPTSTGRWRTLAPRTDFVWTAERADDWRLPFPGMDVDAVRGQGPPRRAAMPTYLAIPPDLNVQPIRMHRPILDLISRVSRRMISQKAKVRLQGALPPRRSSRRARPCRSRTSRPRQAIPRKFLEHILLDLKRERHRRQPPRPRGGYVLHHGRRPSSPSAACCALVDGPMAPVPCLSRTAYRRCSDCRGRADLRRPPACSRRPMRRNWPVSIAPRSPMPCTPGGTNPLATEFWNPCTLEHAIFPGGCFREYRSLRNTTS